MPQDIIFKTDEFVFSYRIAGVLIHDGKILLQKPLNDDCYAIPGGHVSYGETSDQTLIREFREEINADITVDRLIMVGEVFFPWGDKPCQQIGLYYTVSLRDPSQIPLSGTFRTQDELGGEKTALDFCWIPIDEIDNINFPIENIKEYLKDIPAYPVHFISRQI